MTIVITMAGLGSRFRKVGYNIPKYQIEVNGHSLFYWSISSLSGFTAQKYVFVVRREDDAAEFIAKECKKLNIDQPTVVEIDCLTQGQAETATLAEPYWEAESPLFIYNIDTYVEPNQMRDSELKGDGFIPCFNGQGDHWSFVRLGADGRAVEIREKVRISEYCTVGAYYFKTAGLYMELYKEFYLEGRCSLETGERYIAPLYNYLVKEKGGNVYISKIAPQYVHVLGTPEEVDEFQRNGWVSEDAP